jgi:hypothetical protein
MGLSDLNSLGGLLPTYPGWLRTLMFGTALCWFGAYAILYFKAPPPSLTLGRFAATTLPAMPDALTLEVLLNNATGKTATISAALLEFYAEEIPRSGLSAAQTVSATYSVQKSGDDALIVVSADETAPNVVIHKPYAGASYQQLDIPLAQTVPDKAGDRFFLQVADATLIDPRNAHVRLTLTVNGAPGLRAVAPLR